MSDIKITMLGTTGAGKTCFLLGMYSAMREGVRGFTFSTPDPDLDLDLSDRWSRLVHERGAERWPKPNDNEIQTYQFTFSYAFRKLMAFDWIDYRGGAMNGRSTEADVRALYEQVRKSESLFLCVSGEDLAQSRSLQQIRERVRSGDMNRFFSTLAEKEERPSVAVVITKYDLCRERPKEEVVELVQELFNPLFAAGAGWLVTICPVSLGNGLATDRDAGEIDPRNCHLPVTFAIYSAFKQQLADLDSQIDSHRDRVGDMGRTFWRRLINRGDINSKRDLIGFLEKNRDKIERDVNLLSEELLQGATLFHDGSEVEVDA